MQETATLIKPVSNWDNMKYESFEVGNKKILFDWKEEEKYRKAIDDLWLEGQKQLIFKQWNVVVPFPKLSKREIRIWEFFAPKKSELAKYSDSVIPHEVMQIIKLCDTKKYFGRIYILHEAQDDIDPVVLWEIDELYPEWESNAGKVKETHTYLIARWWYALKPFEEIIDYVKSKWVEIRKEKINAWIVKMQMQEKTAEADFSEWLSRWWIDNSVYYDVSRN